MAFRSYRPDKSTDEKVHSLITEPPKLTVFIPVYNRAPYIGAAIDSVLGQSFRDFELLLIDDGSTDGGVAVIERFDDPRIRLYRNDCNRGIPYTRNRGLELARGEYIALLDSDDRMAPRRLERQVAFLDRHTDIATLGGWVAKFDASGSIVRHLVKPLAPDDLKAWLLFRCAHANTSLIGRTAIMREFGYDESFAVSQDFELSTRLSVRYKLANLPLICSYQREHDGRITNMGGTRVEDAKRHLAQRQLDALGIEYDEQDLLRHCRLLRMRGKQWYEDPIFLDWTEEWLKRLMAANERTRLYTPRAFRNVLAQVWLLSCLRAASVIGWRKALGLLARSPLLLALLTSLYDNIVFVLPRKPGTTLLTLPRVLPAAPEK